MLNNITNFFSIFKGKMTKTSPTDGDIIALGTRDPRFGGHYKPTAILVDDLRDNFVYEATQATGTVIDFTTAKVYNLWNAPATGNITNNLTGARMGVVQKIYHNHTIAPTTPAGWVLVGEGFYVPSTLNIINAEWVSGTRVEYWITQ
jgi:hypothetical protein